MPIARLMVRECDVLVVLVAHRYGWVPSDQPDKGTKSITWLECEAMRAGGGRGIAGVGDRSEAFVARGA